MVHKNFKGKKEKQFNFIASNYDFRYNIVTGLYEYRKLKKGKPNPEFKWTDFTDRTKASIILDLLENDQELSGTLLDFFVESPEVSPDYDPFIEYFDHLPLWNEKTDYLQQICETIPVSKPDHFKKTFKKYLVGVVDCLLDDDSVNDVCLVFQSKQGVGKTRWLRKLIPEVFRSQFMYEGNINTKNKDHNILLSQYWFIHLDELETLKSNDISAIKSYITRKNISERKAYGRHLSKFKRRASFLGSVNDDKFLTDTTGNRRWLVFTITDLIDYDHRIDINGLWSQIYFYWKEGFQHWFDIDEIQEINENNEQYREMSLEEEQVIEFFEFPTEEKRNGEYLSTSQILLKIKDLRPQLNLNSIQVGKALAKHSNIKKMLRGSQRYFAIWKGPEIDPIVSVEAEQEEINKKKKEDDFFEGSSSEEKIPVPSDDEQIDLSFTEDNDEDDLPF